MRRSPRHSLRNRLVSLLVLVSLITLVMVTLVLVRNDIAVLRDSMGRDLGVLAEVIGENSRSALVFKVPESARNNLQALRNEYQVEYAALYAADGSLFAAWQQRPPASTNSTAGAAAGPLPDGFQPQPLEHIIEATEHQPLDLWGLREQITITRLIHNDGEAIGAIRIRVRMQELQRQLGHYLLLVLTLCIVTLLVVIVIALYLQRFVSQPILALAEHARAITNSSDDSPLDQALPRPAPQRDDEIGMLYAGFQAMLRRIAARERELLAAHTHLERRVRERTHELQLLLSAMPLGITHLKGRIIARVNPRMTELFGWSRAELIGQSTRRLYRSDDDYQQLGDTAYPLLSAGESYRADLPLRRRDGSIFWARLVGQAIDPGATESIWIIDDIDREKTLQQELRRASEAADAANQAKSEFLANMSHEIRTPINAVIGLTRLLAGTGPDRRQRGYIDNIDLSARALLGVISDILDFSRIEAGKLRLESVPLDLEGIVRQLRAILDQAFIDKRLSLHIELPETLPARLLGDPARLTQVLLNLVGNALKFTEHGSVTLRVVIESSAEHSARLGFEVIDTGIGIPAERQQELFAPFTQAESSTARSHGGSGLGLSISTRLVTLMGGSLRLESTPGVGSRFHFSLRLRRGDAAPSPFADRADADAALPAGDTDLNALTGMRVLVAEDDPVTRLVTHDLLSQQGVSVTLARDGRQALALASRQSFDLLLMDIQMPEMDGYQASRAIRALGAAGELPIIALTAHAGADEQQRCLAAGMNACLTKPIEPERLFPVLCHWLAVSPDASTPPLPPATDQHAAQPSLPPAAQPARPADLMASAGLDNATVQRWLSTNAALYRRMVDSFTSEYWHALNDIEAAMHNHQSNDAARQLHRLRGAAGMLGATGLAEHAAQLETDLRQRGQLDADRLERLRDSLSRVMPALESLTAALDQHHSTRHSAAPTAAEPDAAPPSATQLAQQLATLEQWLIAGNTRALDCPRWLRRYIASGALPASYQTLAEQIDALAFAQALNTLQRLRAH